MGLFSSHVFLTEKFVLNNSEKIITTPKIPVKINGWWEVEDGGMTYHSLMNYQKVLDSANFQKSNCGKSFIEF